MAELVLNLEEERLDHLKEIALKQGVAVNELIDSTVDALLDEYDAYQRFEARASRGDVKRGLDLLQKAKK